MTSIEAPVALEAPPAPKIAKRNVKAAEKAEKVHKKIVKSKSKSKKFWSNQIANKKHTHWGSQRRFRDSLNLESANKRQTVCLICLYDTSVD